LLYQYNLYIRDNLSHKPNLNPFEVLHQMQTEGIIPDLTSYNTLLDICFEKRKFDTALKLFSEMKDTISPVKPDIITYNTVIKGLSLMIDEKNPQLEEIFAEINRVFAEIRDSSELRPNDITYNTLIDAHVKAS